MRMWYKIKQYATLKKDIFISSAFREKYECSFPFDIEFRILLTVRWSTASAFAINFSFGVSPARRIADLTYRL